MRIAIAQYEIERLPQWESYEDKIVRLVEHAKESNAQLLTMGEYAGLELAGWAASLNLPDQFEHIQSQLDRYLQLYSSLAKQHQLYIQPGTLPVKESDGFYRNRAFLFSPNGSVAYQDKLFLTAWELGTKCLKAGDQLRLFDTPLGKIGICICYDCEFPPLVKKLASSGVNLILVPSCTEKFSGLTRVTTSCRARAIENQCYVALSCLIGKATWCDLIDINTGQSALFGPSDVLLIEDGILSQAQLNAPMMITENLSWDTLERVRQHGETYNFRDMQKDISVLLDSIDTVKVL